MTRLARGVRPDLADDRAVAAADDELDRRPHLGQLDVHVLEHARGDALALADEAEEQVLRADVVVVEPLRLVLRERQDLARAIRELVESIHRGRARSPWSRRRPAGHPSTCLRGAAVPRQACRGAGTALASPPIVRPPGPQGCVPGRHRGEGIETTRRGPAGRRLVVRASCPGDQALAASASAASSATASSTSSSATSSSATASVDSAATASATTDPREPDGLDFRDDARGSSSATVSATKPRRRAPRRRVARWPRGRSATISAYGLRPAPRQHPRRPRRLLGRHPRRASAAAPRRRPRAMASLELVGDGLDRAPRRRSLAALLGDARPRRLLGDLGGDLDLDGLAGLGTTRPRRPPRSSSAMASGDGLLGQLDGGLGARRPRRARARPRPRRLLGEPRRRPRRRRLLGQLDGLGLGLDGSSASSSATAPRRRPRRRAPRRRLRCRSGVPAASAAASWLRTWANAAASVVSIPPSGSDCVSDGA